MGYSSQSRSYDMEIAWMILCCIALYALFGGGPFGGWQS